MGGHPVLLGILRSQVYGGTPKITRAQRLSVFRAVKSSPPKVIR
jgi:hypothetical protein